MSDDNDIRVQLTRIEGALGVTNERLANLQSDIADIRRVQHGHGDRLGLLEADKNRREGERKGVINSGRVIGWTISAAVGGTGAFGLTRLLGG